MTQSPDPVADTVTGAVAALAETLANRILALPQRDEARLLAAIAGPPGAGKSTVAEAVVERLVAGGARAVLMPMDGFHLDNRLLEPRGLLARKGAPETFDFGGFRATLERVRHEPSVILPVFDRSREIAIAGAAEITAETRIVVVEGNYLCLDEAPWRGLMGLWDFSAFLEVDLAELEARLLRRWRDHGHDEATARAKAEGNDLINARRIMAAVGPVDLRLASG